MTADAGEIGGWTLGAALLSSGTGAGYVALSSDTTETYAIWAGNATGANAPFSVTRAGAVKATSGNVGGWTLGANRLSSGSSTGYVAIDSDATGTYALWAGNETAASAPFSVTRAGALQATSGTIGGWTLGTNRLSSGSGAGFVALDSDTSGTYAIWAGDGTAANAPFSVTRAGALKATAGDIGGWTIGVENLHSGSGSTYVALDSGIGDYAIWAGADYPETVPSGAPAGSTGNAPFRVKRDGTVYVTALNAVKEDGTTQTVNLSSYPLWKLNYSTIKTHTPTSITLTDGTTLNFNTASSITSGWSGGALTAYARNSGGTVILSQEVADIDFNRTEAQLKSALEASATHSTSLSIYDDDNSWTVTSMTVDASGVYTQGQNSVDFSSTGSWSNGSRTITLTNSKTATVSIPSTATWSSAKVGDELYSVTAIVGGQSLTSTVDTTESYEAGENSVGISSWGSPVWSAGHVVVTITLTNGVTRSHTYYE